jgi:quercetin dioxygenase-like cupin family protein
MGQNPTVVWMPGGVRTEIHLIGAETADAFCLLVDYPPPGWSLPAHLHRGVAETIHVLEGEFEMMVARESSRLGPGQTLHVPGGVIHSGGNVGQAPGRRLLIFSPAGMENFFLEVGMSSGEAEADLTEAVASAIRHGWEFTASA